MESGDENWQVCQSRRSRKGQSQNDIRGKNTTKLNKNKGYRDAVVNGTLVKQRKEPKTTRNSKARSKLDTDALIRQFLLIDCWIVIAI